MIDEARIKDNKEKLMLAKALLEDIKSWDRGFWVPETPASEVTQKMHSLSSAASYIDEMIRNRYYLNF